MVIDHDRVVPAPELCEVARTWWDLDVVPAVTWDGQGRRFSLVDPDRPDRHHLHLLEVAEPVEDPRELARALAEGLAACDFPPTEDRASPGRVRATLRAARLAVEPVDP